MKLINVFILSIAFSILAPCLAQSSHSFKVDAYMRKRVDFWKKVYIEISSDYWFVHDSKNPYIIYDRIKINRNISSRSRNKKIKNVRNRIKVALKAILKKKSNKLTSFEKKLKNQLASFSMKEKKRMINRVRMQQGMSDKFRKGLERSYRYLGRIKKIFKRNNLPVDLSYLPHVESSFNYKAYSKVGAAGIWQIMRSTGRRFRLRKTYLLDERRDPILATKAAAKLLRQNFKKLKRWPLAITAYNIGARGMDRAAKNVGSNNLSKIIKKYRGRRFGFASRNFYPSFIAALEIAKNSNKFFKNLEKEEAFKSNKLILKRKMSIKQIAKTLNLSINEIGTYNLSLRPMALKRNVQLPRNFKLKVPFKVNLKRAENVISSIKEIEQSIEGKKIYKIKKRDNLYQISKDHRVSLESLIAINKISDPSTIYPGSKIFIPGRESDSSEDKILNTKNSKNKNDLNNRLDDSLVNDFLSFYNFKLIKIRDGVYQINIEVDETLGHYSDWLVIKIKEFKSLNKKFKRIVNLGQRFNLPIREKSVFKFNIARVEYHRSIIEDFFNNYKIGGTFEYKVKRGDSLIMLSKKLQIPLFILRRYLPIRKLHIGKQIMLPVVEELK